jgi:hypothetical protein
MIGLIELGYSESEWHSEVVKGSDLKFQYVVCVHKNMLNLSTDFLNSEYPTLWNIHG